jgi:hypothetical protein
MYKGYVKYVETDGNTRKCMNFDMFHEFVLFLYVLTCILNVCTCFVILFLCR